MYIKSYHNIAVGPTKERHLSKIYLFVDVCFLKSKVPDFTLDSVVFSRTRCFSRKKIIPLNKNSLQKAKKSSPIKSGK